MKKVALFLAILMVAMAFAGCGAKAEESQLAEVEAAGQLVLGTSADYPPYEFHKMIEGEDQIIGFDIMIAQKIADEMGVELVIKDMAFDGLIAALQGGKVDLVIAGMSAKPEREEVIDFSIEYYNETQTILVMEDMVDTYDSIEAFEGIKIGAQTATIQEDLAKEMLPNSPLTSLQDITALVLELKTGKIEGLLLVAPVAKAYMSQNPGLAMSIDLDKAKGVAVGLQEGSDLVDPVNEILAGIMEDGTLDQYVLDAMAMVD